MTKDQTRVTLEENPLFAGETLEESILVYRSLKKNEIADDKLSGKDYVGVIISGIIDVYSVSADSNEVKLSRLTPGEIYGISNLYYEVEMETVLRCNTDCEIVFISKDDMREMLRNSPAMMERYATLCNKKINFLLKRANTLTMQTGRAKLAEYIISHEEQSGVVKLTESKESLAKTLGMSRAALFRELSQLKDEGVITISGKVINILDEDALEDIMHS